MFKKTLTLSCKSTVANPFDNVDADEREEDQRHRELRKRVVFYVVSDLHLRGNNT